MNINLKYLLRGTVATLLTMTLLQSCKKHETLSTNEPAQTMSGITAYVNKQTISTSSLGTVEVLKFSNWNQFYQVASILNNRIDILEDSIYNVYAHLTDADFSDLGDSLNFNYERPLDQFESLTGFTNSYRHIKNAQMIEWLSQSDLDFNSNPSKNTLFYKGELSLLNQYQQVMINDTLYQFFSDKYAVISGKFGEVIDYINTNPTSTTFNGEIQTLAWWIFGATPGCTLWKKNYERKEVSSSQRIVMWAGIRSIGKQSLFFTEIENFEKNRRGNYKKERTNMSAKIEGSAYDIDCDSIITGISVNRKPLSGTTKKKDLRVYTLVTDYSPSLRAKNGMSVLGSFYYNTNQFDSYILQW